VAAQAAIGADIQMVLDVCPPLPSPPEVVRLAVERTAAWAARARRAHRRAQACGLPDGRVQALFGIVQGGVDEGLRVESARRTVDVGFDGYGIGGLSVGEKRDETLATLAVTVPELPPDRLRYLMGVGDPVGLVEAVALGVDLFDCVLPTRLGRHGTVLSAGGRFHLRAAANARDDGPLDPHCSCAVCARWSRAYLRHLLLVGEAGVRRLVTLHNLAWTFALVARAREAIGSGTLAEFRAEVLAAWR